ncbi:MAG: hypothetical protein KC441_16165, partial [Anaerolineales bacterium]|nr:hypothetical protein [Anaerolineales bacterium]
GCCGGGGMANISSSPTLTSVTFSGNTSNRFGGGMYGASASPVLTHVTFDGNSAVFEGGGLYSTGPTNLPLTDVTFSGNSATYGGGMYSDHSDLTTTLTNVIFSGNSATNGGGLMMISNTNVLLTNVIFSGNSATYGGGMFTFTDNNATLTNVIFSGNSATDGGGLLTTGSNNLTLTNATISGNSALRYGGGMLSQNGSNPQIRNSILWNNGSSGVYIGNDLGQPASVPVFSSSIVQGAGGSTAWNPTFGDAGYYYNTSYAIDGGGNLDVDPLFVGSGDLHLGSGSPAINAGNNSFLPAGLTTDLDGNARIVGGTVDMGAYEAVVNVPPTLAANQSSVTTAEGQTATNGGTVADADGNSVTLSASAGTVTNNGDGTWSWSYTTNDGPVQSQTVSITADDGNGGTASANFTLTVNNVAPTVTTVTGPASPQAIGSTVTVSGAFNDPGTVDTHTATWNWGDGSAATSGTVTEANGSGTVSGSHAYTAAGVYTVNLTVTDKDGGVGMNIFQYIVVYDASTGHVTGGGWINSPAGAYPADPTLTDTATFGFVAKYQKGNPVPTGNTEFKFQLGNFNFKSTSYQWLIVNQNGTNAQFKGTGSINGSGDYTFMIWATDGNPDTFRIQITDSNGTTVYDNGTQQAIGGGSIVIHK